MGQAGYKIACISGTSEPNGRTAYYPPLWCWFESTTPDKVVCKRCRVGYDVRSLLERKQSKTNYSRCTSRRYGGLCLWGNKRSWFRYEWPILQPWECNFFLDRHKYEVHVNEIPSITDKNTKYLNRQLEESIALECAVSRGQPPPTIHWFKGSWFKICQNIPLRVILLPLNRRRAINFKSP